MKTSSTHRQRQHGLTLVEVILAVSMGALLLGGLVNVVRTTFASRDESMVRNEALEQARYALDRMTRAVADSSRLLIPRADDPGTAHGESLRDPGVLATTLDPALDRDRDGTVDADNDGDGRIDEDPSGDATNTVEAGIDGVDDDGDGSSIDSLFKNNDDDEDSASLFSGQDEDPVNGLDDDGDGAIDEDPGSDLNGDGAPGVAGVDDDGDGSVDEGSVNDDDEDGLQDEDWWDAVVFHLAGTDLMERIPVPWDETGIGGITGRDAVTRAVLRNVASFRVQRLPAPGGGPPLVSIELSVTASDGELLTLERTVRMGGGS